MSGQNLVKLMYSNETILKDDADSSEAKRIAETCQYPISTESYTDKTIALLMSLREDFNEYVGVCGGGTQNICLIDILLENSDIEHITLIDNDPDQLYNFSKLMEAYNRSKTDQDYKKALEQHIRPHQAKFDCYLNCTVNRRRPKIDRHDILIFA